MLTSVWYRTIRTLRIPTLARRLRDAGVILCYHNVVAASPGDDGGEPSLHISLQAFERQMRWLAANCELVSLTEFVRRLRDGGPLRGVAAVTFDDGYAGVLEYAWPLLRALGIPATTFVIAQAPGRDAPFWWDHPAIRRAATPARRREWLAALRGDGAAILRSLAAEGDPSHVPPSILAADWQALRRAVASGMSLGAHSATHRALPTLATAELEDELAGSREVIAREAGVAPEHFAYPYGLWDRRVRDATRAAGYHGALTLDPGPNSRGTDVWSLRRVNIPASISDPAFEAWISGLAPRRGTS